ncbi:uncharacterized protein [Malus domestica]|uniref:uncharacterized protein n=1 Tax=Malus domestica TaxID=3750 RepID=UPI003974B751
MRRLEGQLQMDRLSLHNCCGMGCNCHREKYGSVRRYNFDGAWEERTNRGGSKVILRNNHGDFVAVLSARVEFAASVLHVELLAAESALLFTKQIHHHESQVVLEGDFLITIATMNGHGDDSYPLGPIINDIGALLSDFLQTKLHHVRREENQVAHRLARAGVGSFQELIWLTEPPDLILNALFEDASN